MKKSCAVSLALGLWVSCGLWAQTAEKPQGTTMRIRQEILLGDLSASTDYRARFLPPDNFRVEGTMRLKTMEMDIQSTIVGNGPLVKQLSVTPLGPRAVTVDLARIRKALPEAHYAPSNTYDPSVYREMLQNAPGKKRLAPETLDGAETEGWELPLPEGRLSTPSNVALGLPDPAKIRLWVNSKDGIARKVELEDTRGQTFLKMAYTEVKTNAALPPGSFELTFPDGVTPVDITDMILGGVAATRQQRPAETKPPNTNEKR